MRSLTGLREILLVKSRPVHIYPDLPELVRAGYRSALLVPLNAGQGWRALLIFASDSPDAYSGDQVRLMASMAPTLAAGLARNAGHAVAGPFSAAVDAVVPASLPAEQSAPV